MKITTVRYRRLQSHSRGYGHDAFEAEAQVEEGETADQAMTALRVWVDGQLEHSRKMDRLIEDNQTLVRRLADNQRTAERLEKEIKAGREVMAKFDKLVDLAREHGLADEASLLDQATGYQNVPF